MFGVTKTQNASPGASWGEREVRRLLNSLRRPDLAATDPLGSLLRDVLGTTTAMEAVTELISTAFQGLGYQGTRFAELIRKSDLEGDLSQAGVASEMGLSLRQFFRYRARAIALLSSHIRQLLGQFGADPNPLRSLAELVGETSPGTAIAIYDLMEGNHDNEQLVKRMRSQVDSGAEIPDLWIDESPELWKPLCGVIQARAFELNGDSDAAKSRIAQVRSAINEDHPLNERIEDEVRMIQVLNAKHRHDASEIHRLGRALRETAGDDRERLLRALLIEAEGCIRLGNLPEANDVLRYLHRVAQTNRDVRVMAQLTLLAANSALMTGDLSSADELASGAFFALQEQRPDAALCQMTVARARLCVGKRWKMLPDFVLRPEGAWDRLGLEIIEARYMLRDAQFAAAASIALHVYEYSLQRNFHGLAAHAAATMAACAGLTGKDREEQERYVEAWGLITKTGDRLAGCDVFTMPVVRPRDLGPILLDETMCAKITQRSLDAGAQPLQRQSSKRLMSQLWNQAIAYAGGNSSALGELRQSARALGLTHEVLHTLGIDLALTLPYDRRERWLQRWHDGFGEPSNSIRSDAAEKRIL